ncbi:MAG: dTDP-4-dehydrorhamnose reductase [Ruminococcaceae bacterium]|nr:dTDP-4-dehydrorhamnose reductase [Oscillospiraceae bacterium]
MKILVTGAKGQLGTEIRKCIERGYTELGVPTVLKDKLDADYVDIDSLDISDLNALRDAFKKSKYDAVINCAAFTNVNACETEREIAFKANALGPRNLAIVCEENGAKLIHVSTDYVFAGDASKPYTEWDVTNPQSAYGSSKLLGEEYVKQFCSKYFIVRTAWLYGYYGKNFVKTMMNIARERGACKVVCDQRGNPTNACDLAHHLLKLLDSEQYGIYHGTGNGKCSWYEFTQKIVELAGIDATVSPCTTEEFPTPTKRPAYSSLDNMMFKCTVGDEFREWQDALACFMKNYKGE